MLHVYVGVHQLKSPAPPELTTTISAQPVKDLGIATRGTCAIPLTDEWHYELDYGRSLPVEQSCALPAEASAGMRYVEKLYGQCARCHLCESRNSVVLVKGQYASPVVVIGEGPGEDEDLEGSPFVGPSGRLQTQIFTEVGIDPECILWLDLVGCRPAKDRWTSSRPATLVEKLACSERLVLSLRALRPRTVLCLGKEATALFWDEPPPHNTWHTLTDKNGEVIVVGVTRHPEYLLRSMMTNYKEYYAAKVFLKRLKKNLEKLEKVKEWVLLPRYVGKYLEDNKILCGGRLGDSSD